MKKLTGRNRRNRSKIEVEVVYQLPQKAPEGIP